MIQPVAFRIGAAEEPGIAPEAGVVGHAELDRPRGTRLQYQFDFVLQRMDQEHFRHRPDECHRAGVIDQAIETLGIQWTYPDQALARPVADFLTDDGVLANTVVAGAEPALLVRRYTDVSVHARLDVDVHIAEAVVQDGLQPDQRARALADDAGIAQHAPGERAVAAKFLAESDQAVDDFAVAAVFFLDRVVREAVLQPGLVQQRIELMMNDVDELAGRVPLLPFLVQQLFGVKTRQW